MCIWLDVDECETDPHPCGTNAGCTNTYGSFSCSCNTGYSGNGVTCTGRQYFRSTSDLRITGLIIWLDFPIKYFKRYSTLFLQGYWQSVSSDGWADLPIKILYLTTIFQYSLHLRVSIILQQMFLKVLSICWRHTKWQNFKNSRLIKTLIIYLRDSFSYITLENWL